MTITDEARAALAAKDDSHRELAAAATYPQWRHAIFGLLMGGMTLAPALSSTGRILMLVALLCTVPLIVQSDRKRSGMFISGYRRGKTLYVTFAIIALEMILTMFAVYRAVEFDDRLTAVLLHPVAFAVGWIGSLIWQRVFIAEMVR